MPGSAKSGTARSPTVAEALRLPRLHRHLDEVDAVVAQRLLDDVVGPHADAARGDDRVDLAGQRADDLEERGRVVVDGRLPQGHGATGGDRRLQHVGVRLVDLAGSQRLPGRHELGAGRHDGDAGPRPHHGVAVAGGGEQGHPAGVDGHPGAQDEVVRCDVLTPRAQRGAGRDARPDLDRLRAAVGVLHLDDGVGAVGQHGAGHDPDGLPRHPAPGWPPLPRPPRAPPEGSPPNPGRRGRQPATSADRTAYPSIAELSKPGRSTRERTSSPSTRPRHPAIGRRTSGSGEHRRQHGVAVLLEGAHLSPPRRASCRRAPTRRRPRRP